MSETINVVVKVPRNENVNIGGTYSKIVNVLLYISFCFASIMPALLELNSSSMLFSTLKLSATIEDKIMYVLLVGALESLIFMLLFKLYVYILSYNLYSVLVIQQPFAIYFKTAFLFRNVLVGIVGLLCLAHPVYIMAYNLILLAINTLTFFGFYFAYCDKFVDKLVLPFVYKMLWKPYFLFLLISVVLQIAEVVL